MEAKEGRKMTWSKDQAADGVAGVLPQGIRNSLFLYNMASLHFGSRKSLYRVFSYVSLLLMLAVPVTTTYASNPVSYGAPFFLNDAHLPNPKRSTIDEAVSYWWLKYRQRWRVQPYGYLKCGYGNPP